MDPGGTHGDDGTQEGTEQGPDKPYQTPEHWNCRRNNVGEEHTPGHTAQPDDPMFRGIIVQILGPLEGGEEDPFGRDVRV